MFLFGPGESRVKVSLLCHPSRCHHIVAHGECPGTGDNGNGRRLAVAKDRGTDALVYSDVSALCLVEGLLARCGDTNSDKEVARSLRSQSPLFIQRRGTFFSGRDVRPSGRLAR